MDQLTYVIISILCFVPAIVFHEMAHGFAAWRLGDPTAKRQGRLSANPLNHVDLFGTVLLPGIMMLAGGPVFGYAKPVPYNPLYFKNKKAGEVIVGLAGPCANLAMAVLAVAVAWLLYPAAQELVLGNELFLYFYAYFLPMFALINLYLMFFNLIPIPPLDGSSVLALFVPAKYMRQYYKVQQYALPILMVVLIGLPYLLHVNPIGVYLDATAGTVANLLFPFRIA